MKIAFWSNTGGKSGTTSNLIALCAMNAIRMEQKVVILENHRNLIGIEHALLGNSTQHNRKPVQYLLHPVGLDQLMNKIRSNFLDQAFIEAAAIPFLDEQLFYIPNGLQSNKDVMEYELGQMILPLFEALEKFAEHVIIDVGCSESKTTKAILDSADLIVVNLFQHPLALKDFFANHSNLREKAIYIIGNYIKGSSYHVNNVRNQYGLKKDEIAVIPYNTDFKEALSQGKTLAFLRSNYECKTKSDNYFFIQSLKQASTMMLDKMALCEKPKEELLFAAFS